MWFSMGNAHAPRQGLTRDGWKTTSIDTKNRFSMGNPGDFSMLKYLEQIVPAFCKSDEGTKDLGEGV
jgi:hypothetical protein